MPPAKPLLLIADPDMERIKNYNRHLRDKYDIRHYTHGDKLLRAMEKQKLLPDMAIISGADLGHCKTGPTIAGVKSLCPHARVLAVVEADLPKYGLDYVLQDMLRFGADYVIPKGSLGAQHEKITEAVDIASQGHWKAYGYIDKDGMHAPYRSGRSR